MKYLFICGSISPTYCGIGKYVNKIINYLPDQIEIYYLTNEIQSEYNQSDESAIRNYSTSKTNLRKMSYSSLKDLYKLVREIKPDIINIQHQTFAKNYFDSVFNLISKLASRHTKVINTIHEFEHFTRLGKIRLGLAGLFTNKILFSDPRQMELYNKFTLNLFKPKTSVTIIGSNINNKLESYNTSYLPVSPTNQILHLGYHGFIQPAKGVWELLEALNQYAGSFKLHILGEFKPLLNYESKNEIIEYQQKSLELINSNQKLKDNVIIYGDIDPSSQRFKEILEKVDLLIFPFQDYLTMRRSSFFATLLASNSLAVSSYKEEISEAELEVFKGIGTDTQSILNYLNNFDIQGQVYSKQLEFKKKLANNELERERVLKDITYF